jgi:hypothetical protein
MYGAGASSVIHNIPIISSISLAFLFIEDNKYYTAWPLSAVFSRGRPSGVRDRIDWLVLIFSCEERNGGQMDGRFGRIEVQVCYCLRFAFCMWRAWWMLLDVVGTIDLVKLALLPDHDWITNHPRYDMRYDMISYKPSAGLPTADTSSHLLEVPSIHTFHVPLLSIPLSNIIVLRSFGSEERQ